MKESNIGLLEHIAEIEDSLDPESLAGKLGWRSRDVGVWAGNLTKLRMEGFIEDVYESNSYHGYRLSQKARAMLLTGEPSYAETPQSQKLEVPEDIFEDIIGHGEVKEILRACLVAEKPVHVLLTGPPALAKTLFLWDIERVGGEKAVWLVGSAISKAGLWDLVAAREGITIATKGMEKGQYKPKATMVLGTVKGDLHDMGKNLVALVLRSRGFEVIDLGIDIHEEQFINAVREHTPELLGMSCLMTMTMMGMKDVINALTEAGLRNTVKVIIGGCPVSQEFASQIGADYYGRDAGSTAALLEKSLANIKGKGQRI